VLFVLLHSDRNINHARNKDKDSVEFFLLSSKVYSVKPSV
jgi:hypothetical protein